ncbi:hypothetical protein GCM10023172_16120 [Hymenobacter ginsengisoli]|uniref:TonB C-terminal domain-containing protein n=1 Tax=Hymenobacter ginsengisoli TaxID=1051626 RepID=A0ABP8Q7D6_9BACT|nr:MULTISPECIES: energy transducer TonB [unclassified Hymenobacter]MBO2030844.1 energy transducer TonB [Hymenobacter sp. BT559]
MRYLSVVVCGLSGWLARPAQAQEVAVGPASTAADSVWYEAADTRRVYSQTDSAGTCTEVLILDNANSLQRVFYPSGHLKEYAPYSDWATASRHGLVTTWFDNGQLQSRQLFMQGQRTGALSVYYETGALKRQTDFVAGNEQIGTCFDPEGRPVAYFPYEQLPLYPGGMAQLGKEITKALRLPQQISEVTPSVFFGPRLVDVLLYIAEDGSIQTARVVRSSLPAIFDKAVLAAIAKLSRRFSPARRDGQLVPSNYYLPISLVRPTPVGHTQR